jgi:hypothetical protein
MLARNVPWCEECSQSPHYCRCLLLSSIEQQERDPPAKGDHVVEQDHRILSASELIHESK